MKLFIDECLSDELTDLAIAEGHWEATSVKRRGLLGAKDWELMPVILNEDFVLVTKNSIDFRGPRKNPGSKGHYAKLALHAGLICLNGPLGMNLDLQKELFQIALDNIASDGELVNTLLDVTLDAGDSPGVIVERFRLPQA